MQLNEDYIISAYKDGKTTKQIGDELSVSDETIRQRLIKNNVERRQINRTYSLDENYFDNIDSTDKAYWLGFIAGDGYIQFDEKRATYQLVIALNKNDKKHLEKLREDIDSNAPLYYEEYDSKIRDDEWVTRAYRICISSKKLTKKLIDYGIIQKKAKVLNVNMSKIPKKFHGDFWRGLIDADGWVSETCIGLRTSPKMLKKFMVFVRENTKSNAKTPTTYNNIGFSANIAQELKDEIYGEPHLDRKWKEYVKH